MHAWQIGLIALVVFVVLVGAYFATQADRAEPSTAGGGVPSTGAETTLEERLAFLETCGLKLAEPFDVPELLTSWERAEYESQGWDTVLIGLGMTEEQEPWRNHCVNLWHFDTECIEDPGAYVRIAKRMMEMAGGSLPLEDIEDQIDMEGERASLRFTLNGRKYEVTCVFNYDWADPAVLSLFVKLLAKTDPAKIFIYFDLGGQNCLIGCVTREQLRRLQARGIAFEALR